MRRRLVAGFMTGPRAISLRKLVFPVDGSVSGRGQYQTEIVFRTEEQRVTPGSYALYSKGFRRVSADRERSARKVTFAVENTASGRLRAIGRCATRSARTYHPSQVNGVMTQGYANINSRA